MITGLLRAASAVALILASIAPFGTVAAADSPVLSTGQADYAPGAVVDLHGSGFAADTSYAMPVKRPDGSIVLVDPATHAARPGWDVVGAGADGSLEYGYQLDGIQGSYEARAYPADWNGDWSRIPIASVTFTDAATTDIDQCANGSGVATSCPGSGGGNDWQNGDLNQANSRYREGDSVPFRVKFNGVSGSNTITISWQVTKSSKHAYDYLTTWNRTITGADPCDGVAGCVLASPTSTFAIPTEPTLAAACGFTGFQVPGVFTMWGGTITSVSAYSLSGCAPDPDTENSISITFDAAVSTPVLAWGGHLAAESNWGLTNAAGAIPGASYHMSLEDCTCVPGAHAQDRSIQTNGNVILPAPAIATTADPTVVEVGDPVTDTAVIPGTLDSGFPSGSVDFYYCGPTATPPDCSLGGSLLGTSAVVPALVDPAFTGTATSPPFIPLAEGVYCFRAVYNPDPSALYSSFQHTDQTLECFTAGNPTNVETGSLQIAKVLHAGASGFDPATQFAIQYSCDNGGPAGTVNLAGGTDTTINDIPVESVCTVTEPTTPAPPAGWLWGVGIVGSPTAPITANQTESVTVTNSLSMETAALKITKTLDAGTSGFDTATTFDIDYDCGGAYAGTVHLAGGANTTVSGIPTGSVCTVTEPAQPAAPSGYTWSVVITGSPTAAIGAGTTESVTIANSLNPIIGAQTGSLKITKTLDAGSSGFDTTTTFDIDYDCGGGYSGPVHLAGGDDTTISGIPVASICTVTEPTQPAAPSGWSWTVLITGSPTAAITAGNTESVSVANSLTRDTGSLKIIKTVDAGASDFTSGSFGVHVVCTDDPNSPYDPTIAYPSPGFVTISGIPTGSSCTVTEPAAGLPSAPAGWSWGAPGITGSPATIATAPTAEVTVANSLIRDTGSLKISKTLVTNGASFNSATKFSISYDCGGGYSGTVQLAGGENTTINGIPTGSVCTVTEPTLPAPPSGWFWNTVIAGSPTAAITKGSTAWVSVTNTLTTCKEDLARGSLLTRTVITSLPIGGGTGSPGSPINYKTVQGAYDAAKMSGGPEVIGLFSSTTENLVLDGTKSLTLTQCTLAKVTAKVNTLPVWDITSTGKLTIISPDSFGGTVGWKIETGGHDLKSIRASNATQYGVQVIGSGNSLSFNSVSGSPEGIRVQGNNNDIRGGTVSGNGTGVDIVAGASGNVFRTATVGPNTGNGIIVAGSGNTVRDDTFTANGINGVLVTGANNTIFNNSSYSNTGDGFSATGTGTLFDTDKAYKNKGDGFEIGTLATGTKLRYDESNTGAAKGSNENVGVEYRLGIAITSLGGNKKDNVAFTSTAKGNWE